MQFSKSDTLFVQPSMATGPVVIIPPSRTKDILSMPEDELSAYGSQNETLQAVYTIRDKDIYLNRFHFSIVRNQLTKNLDSLTSIIAEELALAFERHWGISNDWVTVRAWDSILKIVSQAANRVFLGLALCGYVLLSKQSFRLMVLQAVTKSSSNIPGSIPCPYSVEVQS